MMALATSLLFFVISREISMRYSSEIFKRIRLTSIYAGALSFIGAILYLFKITGAASFEWGAFMLLWLSSLHLWGLPWLKWMDYVIPGVGLVIALIGLMSGLAGGSLIVLLLLGAMAYSFLKNNRSWKVLPIEAAVALILLLVIDFVFPNNIMRGWEGIVLLYSLVARLIVYLHNIYHRSITDRLTGLYNRNTFIEYVEGFLKAEHKVGIIFLDIDNFGEKNNTEGHAAGDLALSNTSSLLQEVVRSRGVAGRYGGEELVALIIEDDAYTIAETIRENLPVIAGVTASIGVAYSKESITAQELIAQADDAMYKAKKSGKNKVVIYTYPD